MKVKHVTLVVVVVAILALLLFFLPRQLEKNGEMLPSQPQEVSKVDKEDIEVLETGKGNPYQVFGALVRRAHKKDPQAFEKAKEYLKSPEEVIRAGAIDAIGHLDDVEALELVRNSMRDKSPKVREHALKALAHKRSEERRKLAQWFLKAHPTASVREKVEAYRSLIKLSDRPAEKTEAVLELVDLYAQVEPQDRLHVARVAASLAPREKKVILLMKQIIVNSKSEELIALALRHLAATEPEYVSARVPRYLSHPSARIKMAAVHSLMSVCPENLWSLMKKVVETEKDPMIVKEVVYVASAIGGDQGYAFVREVTSDKKEFFPSDDPFLKRVYLESDKKKGKPSVCDIRRKRMAQ